MSNYVVSKNSNGTFKLFINIKEHDNISTSICYYY